MIGRFGKKARRW